MSILVSLLLYLGVVLLEVSFHLVFLQNLSTAPANDEAYLRRRACLLQEPCPCAIEAAEPLLATAHRGQLVSPLEALGPLRWNRRRPKVEATTDGASRCHATCPVGRAGPIFVATLESRHVAPCNRSRRRLRRSGSGHAPRGCAFGRRLLRVVLKDAHRGAVVG